MGRKSTITAFKFIDSEDMSSTITSQSFNVKNLDKASIRLSWSSVDAVGEIKIQARQEESTKPESPSDWFDVDFGSQLLVDMTAPTPETDHQLIFNELPFVELRMVYTPSSGSGTLTGKITSKVVGA